MKKSAEKSIFLRFRPYWDNAKSLFQDNKKISYAIQNYAVTSIFNAFKQNNQALNENEKNEFQNMIKELAAEKKMIGMEANCTKEEFEEFLELAFANVDDEDRHGEVTMKTSASFKLLGELIDVSTFWGPIDEIWAKRKKYCKFKALDIFKCIKQGIVPKRGGPKEEEDEISKEVNKMVQENKTENNIDQQANINQVDISHDLNGLNIEEKNRNISFNQFKQSEPDISNLNQIPKYNEQSKFKEVTTIPTVVNSYTNKLEINQNQFQNPIHDISMDYLNTNTCTSLDFQKKSPRTLPLENNTKINFNSSMLAADYKVDTKISKKLDFSLPVKFKDIHYFRLCDSIKKQLDNGMKELNVNKIERTLAHAELAYYYLDNITKN